MTVNTAVSLSIRANLAAASALTSVRMLCWLTTPASDCGALHLLKVCSGDINILKGNHSDSPRATLRMITEFSSDAEQAGKRPSA